MYGAIPSFGFCIFIDVKLCYCVEVMVMDRLVNDTIDGCNELIGAYSVYPNSGL